MLNSKRQQVRDAFAALTNAYEWNWATRTVTVIAAGYRETDGGTDQVVTRSQHPKLPDTFLIYRRASDSPTALWRIAAQMTTSEYAEYRRTGHINPDLTCSHLVSTRDQAARLSAATHAAADAGGHRAYYDFSDDPPASPADDANPEPGPGDKQT